MMGKCRKCEYFKKADWSFIPFSIFGTFGLPHMISRVCGFCMDSENPDFNRYARETGRGIGKLQAIMSPKWCRFRK